MTTTPAMTIPDLIEALNRESDRLALDDALSTRMALAHCVRFIRLAKDAEGLAPSRRAQGKSAYRMGCAALGLDHE
jgi:hypothetical protein